MKRREFITLLGGMADRAAFVHGHSSVLIADPIHTRPARECPHWAAEKRLWDGIPGACARLPA
jgi:hypothetical protein